MANPAQTGLPPEIISLIFRFVPSSEKPDKNWQCPTSLALLHICRMWRAVGLDEPSLWTTLNLDFDKYYTQSNWVRTPEQILSFVTGWVRRARGRPLTLNIDGDMIGCLNNARSVALITHLASHVEKFHLELTQSADFWAFSQRRRVPPNLMRWPLLQEVEVMNGGDFYEISHAFAIAPRLKVISDNEGALSPSVATIPWKQLTDFHGKLQHPANFIAVLQQGKNLVRSSFWLAVEMDDEDLDLAPDMLTHSHLEELLLDKGLEIFLPHLALPALRTLDLSFVDLPDDPDPIVEFLEEHSSVLRKLIIDDRLVEYLPDMETLTHLELKMSSNVQRSFPDDLLKLLQSPDSEEQFLPALQQIDLEGVRSRERADYELMAAALAARWELSKASAGVVELRSFFLTMKLVNNETVEGFAELLSPVTDLKGAGVETRVIIRGSKW
ncbi:hypothetical protein DFH06DRAFT_1329588 [Mycena polygramma]|nr:hypothetical protein DFH06DRAFT_1329588 [Mycena polygramma]